jgi:homoserine kinase
MSARRRSATAFGPSSVANLGVGFDALGVALEGAGDLVTASLSRREGIRLVSVRGDRGRLPKDPERNTAAVAAAEVLALARKRGSDATGLDLELVKGLPLASGLGSSAASAVAGAWAAALVLGIEDKLDLLRAVLVAENAADGSWHGDNAFAALLGGIVLVPQSDPYRRLRAVRLPVPDALRLVIVHPDLELETAESRRVLPRLVSLSDQVRQGAAFAELVAALHSGDLAAAGRCVSSDRIVEPARAPLVPGHAAVTRAMKKAGAYGVALAGAGPSLLALSADGPRPAKIALAAVEAWKAEGVDAAAEIHRVDPIGAREA